MGRSQRGWVGELERVTRKKGQVWYVRLRIPRYDGGYLNTDRKLGMVWEGKASPPPGYLNKRQAEEQRQLLAARHVWGDERAPAGTLFSEVAEDWLVTCRKERQLRPTAIRDYSSSVNNHFLPAFGSLPVGEVDAVRIREWVRDLGGRGLATRTVQKNLTYLHNLLEHAVERYGLASNPAQLVRPPRDSSPRQMHAYSMDEALLLVRSAACQRDAAMLATALFAGLRLGEVRALEWSDVHFTQGRISIMRAYSDNELRAPKSGHERSVPLFQALTDELALLKEEMEPASDASRVFSGDRGGVLNPAVVTKVLTRTCERAGIPKYTFHELRHTFGTLAASRVPITTVQAWMGHSDIQTTMKYLHFVDRPEDRMALAQALESQTGAGQLSAASGGSEYSIST